MQSIHSFCFNLQIAQLFFNQPIGKQYKKSDLLLRVRRTTVFVKQTFQKHLILCHIDPNVLWERHVHILFSLKHPILANPRDQKKPRVQHFFFETEDFCCKSKHRSIGGMQLSLKPFFSHLFFSLARKLMKQIELKRRPGNMQRNVKQLQHIERICSTFVEKSGLGAL